MKRIVLATALCVVMLSGCTDVEEEIRQYEREKEIKLFNEMKKELPPRPPSLAPAGIPVEPAIPASAPKVKETPGDEHYGIMPDDSEVYDRIIIDPETGKHLKFREYHRETDPLSKD